MTEQPKLLVMIVDDDADCADELAELLSCHDCKTIVANTLAAALQQALARNPDVVVIDVDLAGADGLELAEMIGAKSGRPPRIVVQSGAPLTNCNQSRCRALGAEFLLKPFGMDALAGVIGSG